MDSSGRSRNSAAVSADGPAARASIVASLASSGGLLGEVTEVRPLLENAVGLRQDRCGAGPVGEGDVGMGHLQKCLD